MFSARFGQCTQNCLFLRLTQGLSVATIAKRRTTPGRGAMQLTQDMSGTLRSTSRGLPHHTTTATTTTDAGDREDSNRLATKESLSNTATTSSGAVMPTSDEVLQVDVSFFLFFFLSSLFTFPTPQEPRC